MRSLLVAIIFLFLSLDSLLAQNDFERKGFVFGTAVGWSYLSQDGLINQKESSFSLPNFKVGAMINPRTALLLYLPGTIYSYQFEGRERKRGFEGIIPSVQYWVKDNWWVLGGAGVGMDAPVFYDIKGEEERKFYFGAALTGSLGYEVWKGKKLAVDVQTRIHYGKVNLLGGEKTGVAYGVLIGLNFY